MIRIALADDHVLVRSSIASLISRLRDCAVVLEASSGEELLAGLTGIIAPDIVITDVSMHGMDGFELAAELGRNYPTVKVLALTMHRAQEAANRMLHAGVCGYITKDGDPAELERALRSIYAKGYYNNSFRAGCREKRIVLSARERAFLAWACSDLAYKQIATKMGVSRRTVDGYRDAVFRKLKVNSRLGIALYALRSRSVVVETGQNTGFFP